MANPRNLQIANILGLILVLVMNTLAITLPIGGRTTGEISDLYPNLFVPAGYAFSIWSLIYVLLIAFVILQAKGLLSAASAPAYVSKIGGWFFLSCLANASWILAWHYLLVPVSVLLMLGILISLIMIYLRLDINYFRSEIPLFVRLSFSVYLGWITVATVANVTALLVSVNWSEWGLSEVTWTVLMILVATIIGLFFVWTRKDLAYIGVLIWAFVAILIKRQNAGIPDETAIITTIYVSIGLMLISFIARQIVGSGRDKVKPI